MRDRSQGIFCLVCGRFRKRSYGDRIRSTRFVDCSGHYCFGHFARHQPCWSVHLYCGQGRCAVALLDAGKSPAGLYASLSLGDIGILRARVSLALLDAVNNMSWLTGLGVLTASAGTDLKDRQIPNELVAAVAAVGLVHGLALRPGQVWLSLLVALGVFCGLGILSHYRIIGGGDLKLISAVTLLVPPERVGQLLIEIALAGGVLGCIYLLAGYALRRPSATPSGVPELAGPEAGIALVIRTERDRIAAGGPLPYALAILGGAVIYLTRELV